MNHDTMTRIAASEYWNRDGGRDIVLADGRGVFAGLYENFEITEDSEESELFRSLEEYQKDMMRSYEGFILILDKNTQYAKAQFYYGSGDLHAAFSALELVMPWFCDHESFTNHRTGKGLFDNMSDDEYDNMSDEDYIAKEKAAGLFMGDFRERFPGLFD